MVAYTKPQHWKKKESEQLRGERNKIKFMKSQDKLKNKHMENKRQYRVSFKKNPINV